MAIKTAIVGGTGYTGVELMRILANHPDVSIDAVTSRGDAGKKVGEVFPNLIGALDNIFVPPTVETLSACDVVFFAAPHGVAMEAVPGLVENGVKVVDLGADFRIKDIKVWESWYKLDHSCPELVQQAVYGLPESNRELIKSASLVACPGCYPTAVQLGFMPLLKNNAVNVDSLIADAKSGVSGAGRQAATHVLLTEASESFKAYAASGHRHLPEIEQELKYFAGEDTTLTFVPHLAPMIRGIEATLYATLKAGTELDEIQALFEKAYSDEPFVNVLPLGSHPETRSVKGANTCQMAVHKPGNGNMVVILSVIDNLVKGAAGQAVQNMNLMFGLEETAGLKQIALLP